MAKTPPSIPDPYIAPNDPPPPIANVPGLQVNPDIWHGASPTLALGQQNSEDLVTQTKTVFGYVVDGANFLQAIDGINQLADALQNLSQGLQNTLGCFGTGLASVATGLAAAATAYAATDAQLTATIQGLEAQLPFYTAASTTTLASLPNSTIPGLSMPLTTTAVYSQLAAQNRVHTDPTSSSSHGGILHSVKNFVTHHAGVVGTVVVVGVAAVSIAASGGIDAPAAAAAMAAASS